MFHLKSPFHALFLVHVCECLLNEFCRYNLKVVFARAEVIMLKIPCIILFNIPILYLHYTSNAMRYSQNYSHEHCQNSPLMLEMICCCKACVLYYSSVKLNNVKPVLLKYINL